jgi:hypothetical protein
MPAWLWPIIVAGIVGFFLYEAIKASESLASVFGRLGKRINEKATAPKKALERVKNVEKLLDETVDKLDCATAYMVADTEYHHAADILIAENCPAVLKLLPLRITYSEFCRRWHDGWRP